MNTFGLINARIKMSINSFFLHERGPLSILCELRVERTLLTRILGELYELHELLLVINQGIVICIYKVKSRSKEIRVIRTIRLKFVLNGIKTNFELLIRIYS
jgi:hypothetical protein